LHNEELKPTIKGPAYPAKTWDLNGHPLLYTFLADDFSGHLVFSASHCASTIVNFQCHSVHGLLSSPNIILVMKSLRIKWAGHVAHIGKKEIHKGFWWGKPEGKRPLGRPRHKLEYNIKMDLEEIGWMGVTCI
jgi:hypothetical protein